MALLANQEITSPLDVETGASCRACQSSHVRPFGMKLGYRLGQCGKCGTIFSQVEDGDAAIASLYDHYYDHAQFTIPDAVAASLERLAGSFEPYRRTGRWLDMGYGEGGVLSIAERRGWEAFGTEISPQALEYGRRRGWTVSDDAENDPQFPRHGFDVVTMIELLEHVARPERFLKEAARLLRPGGVLYVTTPNARSLNRRLLGVRWSIFCPPEHITVWTARGMAKTLKRAGFRARKIRTEGLNPGEILGSLRRGKGQPADVNRNQQALALNSALSRSPARRMLKNAINHCLSAFRIGDGLKVWAACEDHRPEV